jgi:GTP pyrophosphokinase
MSRLKEAFDFMKTKHGVQTRKTGGYYFEHPRRVASYVVRYKDSYQIEDLMIIALLHDVLEDTSCSYGDIMNEFGERVADIVYDVTDELGKNRMQRHEKTYPKTVKNDEAIIVKLCDRMANMIHSVGNRKKCKMYLREYKGFKTALYAESSEECPYQSKMWETVDELYNKIKKETK